MPSWSSGLSLPTHQLVGPLSRVDAPCVDLASSVFQQTGRHFSPALRRALVSTYASCVGMLWPPFSTNQSHFSPASWRTLSRRRTRVASALCGLRFSTNRTPLLASSLAGSLVSAYTSCVGTSWPPVLDSDLSDANPLAHSHPVGTHHHASQVSNQTDATARQYASSLALSRVDVHCFSHCTLGTPHCAWLPPRTH